MGSGTWELLRVLSLKSTSSTGRTLKFPTETPEMGRRKAVYGCLERFHYKFFIIKPTDMRNGREGHTEANRQKQVLVRRKQVEDKGKASDQCAAKEIVNEQG